eukprot:5736929-Prymnesium_polylepis.1
MLAAVAWPMQEMLHPLLARASGARSLLPDGLSPCAPARRARACMLLPRHSFASRVALSSLVPRAALPALS